MTEILFAVSPSVFRQSILCRLSSSAAFLLPHREKGVLWPIPNRTYLERAAVVARVVTGLVDICSECGTGRATWRHPSSSPSTVPWIGCNICALNCCQNINSGLWFHMAASYCEHPSHFASKELWITNYPGARKKVDDVEGG